MLLDEAECLWFVGPWKIQAPQTTFKFGLNEQCVIYAHTLTFRSS